MANLFIDRKFGMYGTCSRVNALVDWKPFAIAVHDDPGRRWDVEVQNVDGTLTDYSFSSVGLSTEQSIEQIEAIFRLAFRSNFARKTEVA